MNNYSQHPLSAAFPSMSDDDFRGLVEDIRAHGQRDVATLADGMIIDGWHRYQACMQLGIPCRLEEFSGDDAVAFVRSKNQHRRHYMKSQQAAIEVSLSVWAESHRPNKVAPGAALSSGGKVALSAAFSTNKEMADRAGTGERTIRQAKRAHEAGLGDFVRDGKLSAKQAAEIANTSPNLAKQVAHGEISLPAAIKQVSGKPEKKTFAPELPPEVADCSPDEYELQEAQGVIRELVEENSALRDRLAVEQMDSSDEGKLEAAQIIEELRTKVRHLEDELLAVKSSRNNFQLENAQLKKQIARMQRQEQRAS